MASKYHFLVQIDLLSFCSMGTDLNLHRKTTVASQFTDESHARVKEVLNRERTWLYASFFQSPSYISFEYRP